MNVTYGGDDRYVFCVERPADIEIQASSRQQTENVEEAGQNIKSLPGCSQHMTSGGLAA